jgi:hypothetical protein
MKLIPALILATVAMTAPAFAACKNFPIVTPDNAPVYGQVTRTEVVGQTSGGPDHNGTAYTKATFCPAAAAPDTCTGESLSTFVAGPVYGPVTTTEIVANNGDVPDIERHRNGLQIGPVFVPLTGYIAGAC